MEIKDVENMLDIPRSQIRFYEKQGLLSPSRGDNNYRCYAQDDVAVLKKIVVLRKLGFSVEEIAAMQNGKQTLTQAADDNIVRLETELERLQAALELSRELIAEQATYESIDEERYWREIQGKEQNGARFADVAKDLVIFEIEHFDIMWKWVFFVDFKSMRQRHGAWRACLALLGLCVLRGIGKVVFWHESFWSGFLYPFLLFAVGSAVFIPLYMLGKKAPRVAERIALVLVLLGVAFLALLVLGIIVALIVSLF